MTRLATLLCVLIVSVLFGIAVPLLRLFDGFQSINVVSSIILAAVFVRLNRGMPSLEWKNLEIFEREQLTKKILNVSMEYAGIVLINSVLLCYIISLVVIGKGSVASSWPNLLQRAAAGLIGGGITLSLARMAYVIWRDLDIIRLQKILIDKSGEKEWQESQSKIADDKVAAIRGASLRKIPNTQPKGFGE